MSTEAYKRKARGVKMRRYERSDHQRAAARLGNCSSGKVAYASKTAVKRHIKVGNRQKYDERPYRCWECGNWHVTTGERYRDDAS